MSPPYQSEGGLMQNNQAEHQLTTKRFAELNGVQEGTVRNQLSKNGHYYEVRPIRLKNGRLLWPAVRIEA